MKLKLFPLSVFVLLLGLSSCTQTDNAELLPTLENDETIPKNVISSEDKRKCNCIPLVGEYCYEDGLTMVYADNPYGAVFYNDNSSATLVNVEQAYNEKILFSSSTHYLGTTALIHNMGCNPAEKCVKYLEGETWTENSINYLELKAETAFDCIWPIQEIFDFKFSLCGTPIPR